MIKITSNRAITNLTRYLFGILIFLPVISYPGLIDGISYVKMMFCLILATPLLVFVVSDAYQGNLDLKIKFLGCLLLLSILAMFYFSFNDYRAVFGAPGRHNGLISIFLAILFMYFGVFVHKHAKSSMFLNAVIFASALASTLSLLASFQIGSFLFPSLNFESLDFRDNTNLLAPLFAMGVVGAVLLTIKSRKPVYFLSQLPAVFFIVKWSLFQSYVGIFLGIIVIFAIQNVTLKSLIPFLPIGIILFYLLSLFVISLDKIPVNLSLFERFLIIDFAKENMSLFTFLPQNIDGLSDFTSKNEFLSPSGFLDDFHNVFLQVFFSYGIFIGLLFLLAMSSVFWRVNRLSKQQLTLLPLFAVFYVTLFFGILSANYMYFGFTILGYLISRSTESIAKPRIYHSKKLTALLILLFTYPISISVVDISSRFEISRLSFSYEKSLKQKEVVEEVTSRSEQIDDAGYRYFVAQNLLAVGECSRAERLIMRMKETNVREIRVGRLQELRQDADCI
jgi:hypothetical protein